MDYATAKQIVFSYVEGWKEGDREKILGSLDPECVIIESYGPTYRGAATYQHTAEHTHNVLRMALLWAIYRTITASTEEKQIKFW